MQEFNEGHITEGCDRLNIITEMVDSYLLSHPAIVKAGCVEDIEKIQSLLSGCYQQVGCLGE